MNPNKLGFGMMRLPLTDPADPTKVDYDTLRQMVDRYMQAGFNYFDTAFPYHGGGNSEIAFRECVAKRYPREDYTITDKLTIFVIQSPDEIPGFFDAQLERCSVDDFDYYLVHSLTRDFYEKAEKFGAFDFVKKKKEEGKVRHIGFSFHDTADVLDEILTNHPEMEYVQLQINYADWEDPDVQARKCYEVCEKHGKPVFIMEPVKGGLLANLAPDCAEMLKEADPEASQASWAIRFAASLPNAAMVLSGMTTPEQVEDNLARMSDFQPLSGEESDLCLKVAEVIRSKASIPCTACRYCVDGCPKNIAIPDYFKQMNEIAKFGDAKIPSAKSNYDYTAQNHGKASDCIECRQCEEHCPQHLPITELLKETAKVLEQQA